MTIVRLSLWNTMLSSGRQLARLNGHSSKVLDPTQRCLLAVLVEQQRAGLNFRVNGSAGWRNMSIIGVYVGTLSALLLLQENLLLLPRC